MSPFDLGGLEEGVLGVDPDLIARRHMAWLVVRAPPELAWVTV